MEMILLEFQCFSDKKFLGNVQLGEKVIKK